MIDAHRSVLRHFGGQKSPLLRGEWPLQNPRVFTSRERSFAPPCLDAFHLWSMGGYDAKTVQARLFWAGKLLTATERVGNDRTFLGVQFDDRYKIYEDADDMAFFFQ